MKLLSEKTWGAAKVWAEILNPGLLERKYVRNKLAMPPPSEWPVTTIRDALCMYSKKNAIVRSYNPM